MGRYQTRDGLRQRHRQFCSRNVRHGWAAANAACSDPRSLRNAAPVHVVRGLAVSGGPDLIAEAYDLKDIVLAEQGLTRVRWAEGQMPVLRSIRERFSKDRPLAGLRIGACLHVTTETANLMVALKAAGAQIAICASNPLSTQDDVAAALAGEFGIPTFAIKGEDEQTYYRHIEAVLASRPNITMDDGCDLVNVLHTRHPDQLDEVTGGTEETTTGVIRLRAMARDGQLRFPV